jgi:hypothetical protein
MGFMWSGEVFLGSRARSGRHRTKRRGQGTLAKVDVVTLVPVFLEEGEMRRDGSIWPISGGLFD